jgi:hypothetical protein
VERNASLGEIVQAPRPDLSSLVNRECVIGCGKDGCNRLARQGDASGKKSLLASPLQQTTSQLILLAVAPAVDIAILVERKGKVATCRYGNDVFEVQNEGGSALDEDNLLLGVKGESEDAVSVLSLLALYGSAKTNLLGRFPSHRRGQYQ